MNRTAISWTDFTWNPVTGCDKVSPGCRNCYAEAITLRYGRSFAVTTHPERLSQVKSLKSGSRVFVNSMSDLFHEKVGFDFTLGVWRSMLARPDITFQILTKRPGQMLGFVNEAIARGYGPIPPHIWLGVSVESTLYLPRLDVLRKVPAYVRFVSFEPLLEDIKDPDLSLISWAIVGGESGPNHRPLHPQWVRNLRDACLEASVPFFFKQWGGARPGGEALLDGVAYHEFPEAIH